ncbi:MAG: glycerol-3-phosphate dehydrogenase, partial [Paracoccaceae bacterium]|nr:glycerol-3-phosphate dehydrogenase [Paracoccaceae bacterium]
MSRIAVAGAGAFGTALAIALARGGRAVTLWARNASEAAAMQAGRENARR